MKGKWEEKRRKSAIESERIVCVWETETDRGRETVSSHRVDFLSGCSSKCSMLTMAHLKTQTMCCLLETLIQHTRTSNAKDTPITQRTDQSTHRVRTCRQLRTHTMLTLCLIKEDSYLFKLDISLIKKMENNSYVNSIIWKPIRQKTSSSVLCNPVIIKNSFHEPTLHVNNKSIIYIRFIWLQLLYLSLFVSVCTNHLVKCIGGNFHLQDR